MHDPPELRPAASAEVPDARFATAVLEAFEHPDATLCLTDETDHIRYASASFRRAFCPHYAGERLLFMQVIDTAIRAGTGIKLVSRPPDDFAVYVTDRRRRQTGSYSFATDTADGSWWWVTDIKLADGWMLHVAQNITGLKQEELRLRDAHASAMEEAQTDHLTGIASRRHGLRRAEALFAAAQATGGAFSLALCDLDHFKAINDRHGHEAGDRALLHLAQHLVRITGAGDRFSRLGGDEFLFVEDSASDVLANRLAAALDRLPQIDLGAGLSIRLSVSVGVAEMAPGDTWPDLMRRADRALYGTKAAHRAGPTRPLA